MISNGWDVHVSTPTRRLWNFSCSALHFSSVQKLLLPAFHAEVSELFSTKPPVPGIRWSHAVLS